MTELSDLGRGISEWEMLSRGLRRGFAAESIVARVLLRKSGELSIVGRKERPEDGVGGSTGMRESAWRALLLGLMAVGCGRTPLLPGEPGREQPGGKDVARGVGKGS